MIPFLLVVGWVLCGFIPLGLALEAGFTLHQEDVTTSLIAGPIGALVMLGYWIYLCLKGAWHAISCK